MLDAIAHAQDIALVSYLLRKGPYVSAIEAAGDRGAHVVVRLQQDPYFRGSHGKNTSDDKARDANPGGDAASDANTSDGKARDANSATLDELRAHNVDAAFFATLQDAPAHLKAIVIDGKVAYEDDRNFTAGGDEEIVRTERPSDIALLQAVLAGHASASADFATRKDLALGLEAGVIESAPKGSTIRVVSESFDRTVVSEALVRRARAGDEVDLVVDHDCVLGNPEGYKELARLVAAGVHVRLADTRAKGCVAGDQAWSGSANATRERPLTFDSGRRSGDSAVVTATLREFERAWDHGKPFHPLAVGAGLAAVASGVPA